VLKAWSEILWLGPIETQKTDTKPRRRLGYLILREKDEITRLICGNLTRMILDTTNLEQKDLWPIDTDSALYANFPEIGNSWQSRFQQFIDEAKQLMVPISPNTES